MLSKIDIAFEKTTNETFPSLAIYYLQFHTFAQHFISQP
jgi:hypothetical protein